jgi:hypothetical protein
MVKELAQFQEKVEVQRRALPDVQTAQQGLTERLEQFGFGIAQKVREVSKEHAKTVLDANKMAGQVQIRDGISHIREKVLDPQTFSDTAVDNYDAQVRGLTKGILDSADPKIKPALLNFASYYGDRNRDVVVTRVDALKKNQMVGGLQEYVDKTKDDAVNAKLGDEVIPDPEDKDKVVSKGDVFMGQINQRVDDAMNRGLITPKEAFTYKKSADKSYEEASYVHQAQQAITQGHDADKWLNSLDKNKNIDQATKQIVKSQALGKVNQLNQSVNTSQNLIKQQANDTVRQVSTGAIDVNSPHVDNVKLRTGALSEGDRQGFEHRLTSASVFSSIKKQMKFMPVNERNSILEKLTPASDDPDFEVKNKMHSALQKESDRLQKEFKDDSFQYVSDNPDVIRAYESRMTAANDGSTKIQPAQLQSTDPLAVALDKEKMMGASNKQLSVMKKNTAANIVASIDRLPDAKSKVQLVNDVFDMYGKYSTIAGRDLQKAGIPQNILYLANLDKIPEGKAILPIAFQSLNQQNEIKDRLQSLKGNKFSDFQNSAATSHELTTIFDTMPNTSTSETQKNSMTNLVALVASGDFLAGNSPNMDKAVQKAANAIFQSPYSAILKEVRVPKKVAPENAKDALYAVEKEIPNMNFLPLSREPSGVKLTKGEQMQDDMHSIETGHWRTIGDDSGAYWVDSQGFEVKVLEKGQAHRLEIHWEDLRDSTSELHTLMAKHKRKRFGLF